LGTSLQKTLKLWYPPTLRVSDGGLVVGPNSSSPLDSPALSRLYTTPLDVFRIYDEPTLMYAHALFALADSKLGVIEANFAPLVLQFLDFLVAHWPSLLHDLEHGTLSFAAAKLTEEQRNAVTTALNQLSPQQRQQRVSELRRIFEAMKQAAVGNNNNNNSNNNSAATTEVKQQHQQQEDKKPDERLDAPSKLSTDSGSAGGELSEHQGVVGVTKSQQDLGVMITKRTLIKALWPHLQVIMCTSTGSFEVYARRLADVYGVNVPLPAKNEQGDKNGSSSNSGSSSSNSSRNTALNAINNYNTRKENAHPAISVIGPEMDAHLKISTDGIVKQAASSNNSVPLYSPIYAATEGLLGLNLQPSGSTYYLVPTAQFFEFIPVEDAGLAQPQTLLWQDVVREIESERERKRVKERV
jgi:hypothetical protein